MHAERPTNNTTTTTTTNNNNNNNNNNNITQQQRQQKEEEGKREEAFLALIWRFNARFWGCRQAVDPKSASFFYSAFFFMVAAGNVFLPAVIRRVGCGNFDITLNQCLRVPRRYASLPTAQCAVRSVLWIPLSVYVLDADWCLRSPAL